MITFQTFLTLSTNIKIVTAKRLSSKKLREAVGRVMNEEVEEMEHNISNITCDTPFQSPVSKSVQNKDASWSLLQAFWQEWLKISKDVVSNQTNRLTR